ncbi:MAG: DUF4365 domain-containing protein [Massilia sp.]
MTTGDLPQQSDSQRIGADAEKCFRANCPSDWVVTDTAGTGDFGFDFAIQALPQQRATDAFKVQLKGTRSPKLSADGSFYSIDLKASTIRYYHRATEPILLIVADLTADSKAKNCPLFYCWIHKELERLNAEELPDERRSVTLQVPTANRLDDDTDLSIDLQTFKSISELGPNLYRAIESSSPYSSPDERISILSEIPASISARGFSLIEALSYPQATPWLAPPQGSMAWHLLEAVESIKAGNAEEALEALNGAERMMAEAAPAEIPEYWLLLGKTLGLQGDDIGSLAAFLKAKESGLGHPKYLAAWAEAAVRATYKIEGANDYSDILHELTGNDPLVTEVRSRVFAASGQYDKALEEAGTLPAPERQSASAIVLTMQSRSAEALAACEEGLAVPQIKAHFRQLFLVMKARARFFIALSPAAIDLSHERMPPSGAPNTDIGQLRLAWIDINEAARALRKAGWPPNVEFLSDIWPATASILGKQAEILPQLLNASLARPQIMSLHAGVESVAAQLGEWNTALKANARQIENEDVICRRIALLHSASKDSECVALFDQSKDTLDIGNPMFAEALAVALLSAGRIARTDKVAAFREQFESVPSLASTIASADYFLSRARNPLANGQALANLQASYEALGRPVDIANQLFHALDATKRDQAQRCVELSSSLQQHRLLTQEAALHLAQAFLTLGMWPELLDLARDALSRFDDSARFAAAEAVALDRLGRTPEARAALEAIIESGANEPMALNAYVNLAARMGFVQEAFNAVETILSNAHSKKEQLECLRLLFNLRRILDPEDSRTVDIALRIGALSDPAVELEEGIYLSMLVTATSLVQFTLEPHDLAEFERRLDAFFKAFPQSTILRRGELREDATREQIIAMIKGVIGDDDGREAERRRFEIEMKAGRMPVPFAWRPRHLLPAIPDIVFLWEIAKKSKMDERQFHLNMVPKEWAAMPSESLHELLPILDLTSLLVAQDLDILRHIFTIFPKVAIGQATISELARLTAPLTGSIFRARCVQLQDFLKARFEQIDQPYIVPPDRNDPRAMRWPTEEIRELATTGTYLIYSDDMLERILCARSDTADGICALDVLSALESRGKLSTREVAEKISLLCGWKVGLVVDIRYQEAILPPRLNNTASTSTGVGMIQQDVQCMRMMNAIWDLARSYEAMQGHAGALLRQFAAKLDMPRVVISSLLGVWFIKAKLRPKSPDPLRILCFLVLEAFHHEPLESAEFARRVLLVFLDLVELHNGRFMDERKERDAIALLGTVLAEVNLAQPETSRVKERLEAGFTAGTSNADNFASAFTEELVRQSKSN